MGGHVGILNHFEIRGWATDDQHAVGDNVVIAVNGDEIGRIPARIYRQDLKDAIGIGDCAFHFTFSETPALFSPALITVRSASSGRLLGNGEQILPALFPDDARERKNKHSRDHVQPSQGPRLIIHVGPHKTGSSYIQVNLALAQGALRDVGVDFPDEWRGSLPSHFQLFRKLRAGYYAEVESDFASVFARGAPIVIVSAEDISDLNLEQLMSLREAARGSHVEIVFYLRRWSDLLPSGWQEEVKRGMAAPFVDWVFDIYSRPRGLGYVNFSMKTNKFAQVFGNGALRIVSFSNLVDAGIDIFDHFMEKIVGLSDLKFPNLSRERVNVSLPIETTELLRLLNLIGVTENSRRYVRLRGLEGIAAYSDLRQSILACLSPTQIDDSTAAFRELYNQLNAEFADKLVSREFGQTIFSCRGRQVLSLRKESFFAKETNADALKKFRNQLEEVALATADR
jgi:hypothetical protein